MKDSIVTTINTPKGPVTARFCGSDLRRLTIEEQAKVNAALAQTLAELDAEEEAACQQHSSSPATSTGTRATR